MQESTGITTLLELHGYVLIKVMAIGSRSRPGVCRPPLTFRMASVMP